ncbi:MAG: molybdopterin-dependent oxidoreductase [Phycisphaerae bacterium]
MIHAPKRSWIERAAVRLGVIADRDDSADPQPRAAVSHSQPGAAVPHAPPLKRYPDANEWDDVVVYDPAAYPRKIVERRYRLVPTTCFNCESACGLLAYVDKDSNTIRKLEGNPLHPGSRGKNCAKGPATINQINDPDRILSPMKRVGKRGDGQWREVSWDEAIADIAGRIRTALHEKRHNEIIYHVGRPGSEGFVDRILKAWGVDGHNSHTNICSAGARFGYALWSGYDRPSPDYANARFILALNSHLESGHYFNPHAQRISEGIAGGAKLAVMDPRLSNTASMAHYWLPTRPGSEAAVLLAMAHVILEEGLEDRAFIERWVNWEAYLEATEETSKRQNVETSKRHGAVNGIETSRERKRPDMAGNGEQETGSGERGTGSGEFIEALKRLYAEFTPAFAEAESGVSAATIVEIARRIGAAGSRFCSHTWRGAASAHLGGWQTARTLQFLNVLTGSVGTVGGTSPSAWNKYKAALINPPPPQDQWNELLWPREYPLAHYEMSFLLPHYLKEGRGRADVYFTRVFNPVWTYPDGFTWIEVLRDESKVGLHVALTPTWNETALFADYVLPMGHGPERHDLNTYETHNAVWIAFRQPVLRASMRADGKPVSDTREANPGLVWEEDEFWLALTRAIDPDGSMGIRQYADSAAQPGEPLTVDEYYAHIFDNVAGLPETAAGAGCSPLDYMRKSGAFEVQEKVNRRHERRLTAEELAGAEVDATTGVVRKGGAAIGVEINGVAVEGFGTPSRKLEFYSPTMVEWGWPEHAVPGYIRSHIYEAPQAVGGAAEAPQSMGGTAVSAVNSVPGGVAISEVYGRDARTTQNDAEHGVFCLLPTFRLPTLIHTRSGSAKWLNEISQRNPVWIHTRDAGRLGVRTGDLVRITTDIGYFVDRVWVTESIRPGVVACSHHLGRWRRKQDPPSSRWSGNVVDVQELGGGQWRLRTVSGPGPFESADPDSRRIWWRDGGVPQNLTFPVHPDPISGQHCWHQKVNVERAARDDRAGDVFVDTEKSMRIYREWLKLARPDAGPPGLRRPLWFNRPLRPTDAAFRYETK